MTDVATTLDEGAQALRTPYVIARTKLGSNTNVLDEQFICNVECIKFASVKFEKNYAVLVQPKQASNTGSASLTAHTLSTPTCRASKIR